ncbi:TlpA family protein disulfide reductase [Tamlana sp. 62-3]|uniref:TlpA family protein disulfide reductase n=1 Tax=Neotamlana sargassicola TaxID=2883125 RepID=A0A9X1L7Y1_9FLAO|nr:TlpA disulfide reductase family protein [Tamlana sargassicola]MCB4809346.1 TlpA family protein disulfide reductase [Tamlana sargassicola]
MNLLVPKYFIFIVFFGFYSAFGQIRVSQIMSESQLAKSEQNALYFVDFWATWCNPCIHVSQYLETLQSQYPKNFYVLSLSQESPEVVAKFLAKHDLKLAVGIDFDGETFKKYNIYSLPQGVLFNAKGEKLWEGHPANFKKQHLESFLRENKNVIDVNSFFKTEAYAVETSDLEPIDFNDFEYRVIDDYSDLETIQIIENDSYIELSGSLQKILSYVYGVYYKQIKISDTDNRSYSMRFTKGSRASKNMKRTIFKSLKLNAKQDELTGDVLTVAFNTANFWDTSQFNWEGNNQKFLIGDSEIQADNVTFNDVIYKVSNLIEKPILVDGKYEEDALHDWQIHYKYYELMVSNFQDYGIQVSNKNTAYPVYNITKKAP